MQPAPPAPAPCNVVSRTEGVGAQLIGASAAHAAMLAQLERIAQSEAPALIEGETGSGKELAARAIHHNGARRTGPFVPMNCGALPDSLIESELFGVRRGAFTDARESHRGLVAEADGGTLFLDEVEAGVPIEHAPRATTGDHLLVLHPHGACFAGDRAMLASLACKADTWRLGWRIERSTNLNLDPAPARLCIALHLRGGDLPRRLAFDFSVQTDGRTAPPNEVASLELTLV